ncbi:hypothetical protein [Secundilactobacillus kimchicus]|uniref:hypothetical protein n=1 Tax=Secundilactobacillus kimchicus TaxID=528209 RepID=UPI0024A9EC47|nr:hypothetical protein [Secundilactobacillus kimchicus]
MGLIFSDGKGNAIKPAGMYYADGKGNATKVFSSFVPAGTVLWKNDGAKAIGVLGGGNFTYPKNYQCALGYPIDELKNGLQITFDAQSVAYQNTSSGASVYLDKSHPSPTTFKISKAALLTKDYQSLTNGLYLKAVSDTAVQVFEKSFNGESWVYGGNTEFNYSGYTHYFAIPLTITAY